MRSSRDPEYPYGYPNGERRFLGAPQRHEYDPYAPLQGRPPGERRPLRDEWQRPQRPRWQDAGRPIDQGVASSRPGGAYREQVWGDPNSGYLYVTGGLSGPGGLYETSGEADRWRSEHDIYGARGTWGRDQTARSFGHSGKGPKGYTRSDERILEDVSDRLSDDDEVDASDITVTVSDAEVRLEGTVSDRHSKHRAEDIAGSVSGVREVSNHLRTRKTFFQEIGDKIAGEDKSQHQGHAGSGTQNSLEGGRSAQH
jgi:osmotically-inducible protein OsmY